jgi:hypothetical protein
VFASTLAHATALSVNPRDVVVAIIGGTMLTVALTRPRLRWVENLTESSESNRAWAERALTMLAFAMGGYAWDSLFLVLHRQLGWEIDTVLRGASYFLITYAWLVHFEPFVAQWRLSGWIGAIILYSGIATFAASVGVAIANSLLIGAFSDVELLLITGSLAIGGIVIYKLIPHLEASLDRVVPWGLPSTGQSRSRASEDS